MQTVAKFICTDEPICLIITVTNLKRERKHSSTVSNDKEDSEAAAAAAAASPVVRTRCFDHESHRLTGPSE